MTKSIELSLKEQIEELKTENLMLQKELAVKNVISEISRAQGEEDKIELIYEKIFSLISEIIHIKNFYICLLHDDLIEIPFMIDEYDNFKSKILNEKTNPELRSSLTAYALGKGVATTLNKEDINRLQSEEKVNVLGKIPTQWVFLPFQTSQLKGGIVAQSYNDKDGFTYSDMSMLAYVTMHIGIFLSSFKSRLKIKQQYDELKATQSQLVHSEKMASIGQLAAGVAHEINNPLGYVNSNLNALKEYVGELGQFIDELAEATTLNKEKHNKFSELLDKLKQKHDIDFILTDTNELVSECIFGMEKVKNIIQSLNNFTHAGEEKQQKTSINDCLDETVRIVWNELKYHCEVKKNFGELPDIYCHPSQLNQVFMNLLINAGHAIEENGIIEVSTYCEDNFIILTFKDNGSGIDEKHVNQLFNPFFTTKPVGQGTGLGLSISYGIIENHNGNISVASTIGEGTCFTIKLPIILEPVEIDFNPTENDQ